MFHGKAILWNETPDFSNCEEREELVSDFSLLGNKWVNYKGNFNQDQKHGEGTLYLCNGDIFKGSFDKNIVEGFGTYKRKAG